MDILQKASIAYNSINQLQKNCTKSLQTVGTSSKSLKLVERLTYHNLSQHLC